MPELREHWLSRETVDGWKDASDRFAGWFDWTTPNWITAAHIAVTPLIYFCLAAFSFTGSRAFLVAGAATYTLAVISDWLDGALARWQHRRDAPRGLSEAAEVALPLVDQLRLRGNTQLGKRLDPIADKATFYAALLPLGVGFVPTWIVVANVAFALALTAIRWKWAMRALGLRDAGSNWFGKRKMWIEIFVVSSLVLLVPWPDLRWWTSSATLAAATLFAVLSLVGHFVKNWRLGSAGAPS